ncbi:molybdopterin molybdotransferase [Rhodobacteraceae bacterium MBR-64]
MISVEEALARVLGLGRVVSPVTVPLAEAAGRVMLEAATARRDQPPFPASAMDGYALCPGEAGVGTQYAVVGEAGAGHGFDGALGPGQAVRIFTGAPVPRGADRVVIQEDVTAIGGRITLTDACPPNANIRPQGADFKVGAQLAAPRRLSPADIALLAAMNIAKVRVARKPVVAVIATGDELVMPGEAPRPDQIIASNAFALKAMAEDVGAEVRLMPIARDTPDALRTIFGLAQGADLIVTIGGASVGDHDHVGAVAESLAMERAFYKIAMRPGKPLMAGRMGGSVMLGLPGNPVSSIVCGHIFMLPLLRRMLGLPDDRSPMRSAILTDALPANGPRAHYMRARLTPAEALPHITPFGAQDSSLLTVLAEADALLVRAPHEGPRAAGDTVPFISLDRTSR